LTAGSRVRAGALGRIASQREFHRPDWSDLVSHVSGVLKPFDFYFDFVVAEVEKLEALWDVYLR
jgi:tetrahydromethanopterin S-methyltransferase subunit E